MQSRRLLTLLHRKNYLILDMNKIDVVKLDDSNELGAHDRYTLSFYSTNAADPAVVYNVTEYTSESQLELISRIYTWWGSTETPNLVVNMDSLPRLIVG